MPQGQSVSGVDGRVPVFVFPASLTFYADDQSTHKQILTIYNPYDFALKFKVLTTAPRKYTVVDSEGTIKTGCCIDIVIRHTAILPVNYGAVDKFRIQIMERGHRQVIGRKDVTATLCPNNVDSAAHASLDNEHFEQLPPSSSHAHSPAHQYSIGGTHSTNVGGTNVIGILVGVVCVIALMLPTRGVDDINYLPSYLHISLTYKLVFAYALGLCTMVVFKT